MNVNLTKPELPHGWIVKQSKSYPDRVYYFNVHTGSSTWEVPDLLKLQEKERKLASESKKKSVKFSPEARFSPELSSSDGCNTPGYVDPDNSDDSLDLTSSSPTKALLKSISLTDQTTLSYHHGNQVQYTQVQETGNHALKTQCRPTQTSYHNHLFDTKVAGSHHLYSPMQTALSNTGCALPFGAYVSSASYSTASSVTMATDSRHILSMPQTSLPMDTIAVSSVKDSSNKMKKEMVNKMISGFNSKESLESKKSTSQTSLSSESHKKRKKLISDEVRKKEGVKISEGSKRKTDHSGKSFAASKKRKISNTGLPCSLVSGNTLPSSLELNVSFKQSTNPSSTAGSAGSDTETRRRVVRQLSDESNDLSQIQNLEKAHSIQSWIDKWEPCDPQIDSLSDLDQSSSTTQTSPDSGIMSSFGDLDNRKIVNGNFSNNTLDSGISLTPGGWQNYSWKDVHSTPAYVDSSRAVENMEIEDFVEVEDREIEDMDISQIILKEVREHVSQKSPNEVVGQLTAKVNASVTTEYVYQTLVIVIDTCVLISDLKYVMELRDLDVAGFGRPTLIIPWVVMQELDSLKDSKNKVNLSLSTEKKARDAVRYLHDNFLAQHPRVIGQTPSQAKEATELFKSASNDDRILQSCLQCQKIMAESQVVLLSNDRNLCSKSLVSGIKAFCRTGFLANIGKLKAKQCKSNDSMKVYNQVPDTKMNQATVPDTCMNPISTVHTSTAPAVNTVSGLSQEKLIDEMYCHIKAKLKESLSGILQREMKRVYGEIWMQVVLRKPPWTLLDVVECLIKHWMAVFGDVFKRYSKPHVDTLLKVLKNSQNASTSITELSKMIADSLILLRNYKDHYSNDHVVEEAIKYMSQISDLCSTLEKGPIHIVSLDEYLKQNIPNHSSQQVLIKPQQRLKKPESSLAVLSDCMAEKAHSKLKDICSCIESFIISVHEFLRGFDRARDQGRLNELYIMYEKIVPAVTDFRYCYSRSLEYTPKQVKKQAANVHDLCVQVNGFFSRCCIPVQGDSNPVSTEEMQALFSSPMQRDVLKRVLPLLDKNIFKLHEILAQMTSRSLIPR